ncbi:hypothetical protein [Mesorhizobium sp. 10J20-29]
MDKGAMDSRLLYASPSIDIAPSGPEQVFSIERTDQLLHVFEKLNANAVG